MPFAGRIEALSAAHERRGFSCGEAARDDYLRRFAGQHAEARISRSYVAVKNGTVLGYYSLSLAADGGLAARVGHPRLSGLPPGIMT